MARCGVIYVLHNPSRYGEHTYNIGFCNADGNDIDIRIPKSTSHGMDTLVAYFAISDADTAETVCHEKLKKYRTDRGLFELPIDKLLSIIDETIEPYRLYDFCSVNIEKNVHEESTKSTLFDRLSKQRQRTADDFLEGQELIKKSSDEVLSRKMKWRQELLEMIPVLKEVYKDINFLKWHTAAETDTTEALVKVIMLTDSSTKPMRLLFTRYAKTTDPAKTDGTRTESRMFQGEYIEDWKEEDDGRVAEAAISMDKYNNYNDLIIAVASIEYDEYNLNWKKTGIGHVRCSKTEEAIEKFNMILAEYVAAPIAERRSPAPERKAGARGTSVKQVNYKTKLFDYSGRFQS